MEHMNAAPDDGPTPATAAGSWFALATETERAVSARVHGEVGAALQALGDSHGVAAQTLRRLVAAKRFTDLVAVGEPALATGLRNANLAAAEAIARWWKRDPNEARAAALQLVGERLSVREIEALERRSRPRAASTLGDRMQRATAVAIVKRIEHEMSRRHGVDYRATWSGGAFRPAVRRPVTPRFMRELSFEGAIMTGLSMVLTPSSATDARPVAVAYIHSRPENHAAALAAQLAGLTFVGFGGLLVSPRPEDSSLLLSLAEAYAPAELQHLIVDLAYV